MDHHHRSPQTTLGGCWVYNFPVWGLQMHFDFSKEIAKEINQQQKIYYMATPLKGSVNKILFLGSEEDLEDEEGKKDECCVGKHKKTAAWAPHLHCRAGEEQHSCISQEMITKEALDSFAGLIKPAALFLCHYIETHRAQWNFLDKAVLEIGAGTGLVSVVAALLGAWVTATDLPEVLEDLRFNLSRNTTGRCLHTPQIAALSWDFDLEQCYPSTVYRYDYVLAADVVYHHKSLDELLATMKHFCKLGTTLIWANKVRLESDWTFVKKFKKTFSTQLLAEDGEMKIFMATSKDVEEEDDVQVKIKCLTDQENEEEKEANGNDEAKQLKGVAEQIYVDDQESRADTQTPEKDEERVKKYFESADEETIGEMMPGKDICKEDDSAETGMVPSKEDSSEEKLEKKRLIPNWTPTVLYSIGKDIYHYVGEDIVIYEALDSYGGMMWPAALSLCSFLENNRQTVNLQGKKVLELGAGTGLVAIVASLLGASVTATDLPEMLGNLTANVMRNTRRRCLHTPQIAALSWGFDLELTYPSSVYQYDYVLGADVVYHHNYLDELLATMKHFCKPGTTLIWANKVRFETDQTFTENFKKAFNTHLLAEDGQMKIFMATSRDGEEDDDVKAENQNLMDQKNEEWINVCEWNKDESPKHLEDKINYEEQKSMCDIQQTEREDEEEKKNFENDEEMEEILPFRESSCDQDDSAESKSNEDITSKELKKNSMIQQNWVPKILYSIGKDIYHYVGEDIVIYEAIDSYGGMMWPAALSLCSFLENNRQIVNLQGKKVLELGAGTGLVAIVASLLGASVTATDLPEMLGNLTANVMRNTRRRCLHTPQIAALSWGFDLEQTYPSSVYQYDYVLGADVVYHHNYLDELLATMKHFCKPGTTLIWANKVRFETDQTFTDNFKKAFNTHLLAEDGQMKIFMATSKERCDKRYKNRPSGPSGPGLRS